MCEENSFPKIVENVITRNGGVGVLGRQGSLERESVVHSNVIVSNEVDVSVMKVDSSQLCAELDHSNTIEKEIYSP